MADALVVGISQSGRSPDIVAVRRRGAAAGRADRRADQRRGLPAGRRRPTTWSTCAPDRSGRRPRPRPTRPSCSRRRCCRRRSTRPRQRETVDLAGLPALISAALTAEPHARDLAAAHAKRQRAVVLGRGYSYASARERAGAQARRRWRWSRAMSVLGGRLRSRRGPAAPAAGPSLTRLISGWTPRAGVDETLVEVEVALVDGPSPWAGRATQLPAEAIRDAPQAAISRTIVEVAVAVVAGDIPPWLPSIDRAPAGGRRCPDRRSPGRPRRRALDLVGRRGDDPGKVSREDARAARVGVDSATASGGVGLRAGGRSPRSVAPRRATRPWAWPGRGSRARPSTDRRLGVARSRHLEDQTAPPPARPHRLPAGDRRGRRGRPRRRGRAHRSEAPRTLAEARGAAGSGPGPSSPTPAGCSTFRDAASGGMGNHGLPLVKPAFPSPDHAIGARQPSRFHHPAIRTAARSRARLRGTAMSCAPISSP